jgi:hypothetical protein
MSLKTLAVPLLALVLLAAPSFTAEADAGCRRGRCGPVLRSGGRCGGYGRCGRRARCGRRFVGRRFGYGRRFIGVRRFGGYVCVGGACGRIGGFGFPGYYGNGLPGYSLRRFCR